MVNLYDKDEIERINKSRETNDKLEEFFNSKREDWKKTIDPLFESMKNNFTLDNAKKIIDIQSMALSFRQALSEEISFFLNKRSREEVKLKKLKQDKFVFYATGFGLKTSLGEKSILIDAHTAESERNIQLIDVHIDFLRTSSKNLEALGFSIKNIVELMTYLSK